MTELELMERIAGARGVDREAMDRARRRQAELAKPPGSLGRLEDYAVVLAGIQGRSAPRAGKCRVLVFAGDNGVVAQGVSSAPQSVTVQQCINMTRHKTGMSAMAHHFGDSVVVTDVGINAPTPEGVVNRKVRWSTGDISREAAMTRQQALDAMAAGMEAAEKAKSEGVDIVGIGEMGIGNTTTSAAVLAVLTGATVEQVCGRGGGLTDEAFAHKKAVINGAIRLHQPCKEDILDTLSKVGGLDIAAMCGAFIGCAVHHLPAVVDGYISIVAALCAARLCPAVKDVVFLSHASFEIGYQLAASELGQQPPLGLGMRLGEGSGCVVMFRVLEAACAAMNEMATFSQAAINDDYLADIRKGDAFTVTP